MPKRLTLAVCVAVVALALTAAAASAVSYYTYCGNCVITAGNHKTSGYWDAFRSYGQRTGGPGWGPQMRVTASQGGTCDTGWTTATQAWCDFAYTRNVLTVGRTYNGSPSGNYTFKAHLTAF